MAWIMILLVWLVAPFAELGVIIGLLVSNQEYKKRIQELERGRLRSRAFFETGENAVEENMQPKIQLWHDNMETAGAVPSMPLDRDMGNSDAGPQASDEEWHEVKSLSKDIRPQERQPVSQSCCAAVSKKVFQAGLGTMALVLGVILTVLAGLIFATTTWHILPDICKAYLVLLCAFVFFAASYGAENIFHIHRTGNGLYILGSIFLFLAVLAAAYFQLLGAEFILDKENRWKVLWVGSTVTMGAFWAGMKRFQDRVYTQTCLWGISLTLFFMAKALSAGWNGFVCMMMIYSTVLIAAEKYWMENTRAKKKSETFQKLLAHGFQIFAPVHFWTFAAITMVQGLIPIWRMAAEGCVGTRNTILDRFSLLSFTASGMGAMGAALAGIWILAWKDHKKINRNLGVLAATEAVLYGAGWITADFIYRMALINMAYLLAAAIRYKNRETYKEIHSLFLDVCGCLGVLFTAAGFYGDQSGRADGLALAMAAFAGHYIWFYLGKRQWPHLLASIGILPLPFMAGIRLGIEFDRLSVWTAAALLLSGMAARRLCPVIKKDDKVHGGLRMDWYHIVAVCDVLLMVVMGNDWQRFVYLLLSALYFLQYLQVEKLRKPALGLSACCAAAAFWIQPFILWPSVLELEMKLLPVVWLLWAAGKIWEENQQICTLQNAGYGVCLILLCQDGVFSGQVADSLILEGICLVAFIRAQVKNNVLWVRISAAVILGMALFMTRNFWLSISWRVYLLAAGMGLMIFAGIMEKKIR